MLHSPLNNPHVQTISGARAYHIWYSRAIVITARAQPDSQSARARNMHEYIISLWTRSSLGAYGHFVVN